jgi:hypothetical protein
MAEIRALFLEKFHIDARLHVIQLPRSGNRQKKAATIAAVHTSRCEDSDSLLYVYNSENDFEEQSKPVKHPKRKRLITHRQGYELTEEAVSYTPTPSTWHTYPGTNYAYRLDSRGFSSFADTEHDTCKDPSLADTVRSAHQEYCWPSFLPVIQPGLNPRVTYNQGDCDAANSLAAYPPRPRRQPVARGDTSFATVANSELQDPSSLPSIWETARATSAAPTYFHPIQGLQKFVDGGQYFSESGTRCNNPTTLSSRASESYATVSSSMTSLLSSIALAARVPQNIGHVLSTSANDLNGPLMTGLPMIARRREAIVETPRMTRH